MRLRRLRRSLARIGRLTDSIRSSRTKGRRAITEPTTPKPPERIIAAGRRLFFSEGFAKVSTEMLAREASVSKATLYKYFPNMTAVLRAVVEHEATTFESVVPSEISTRDELLTALIRYGSGLLAFLNQKDIIQFTQLMFEEARTNPDIASTFYSAAYGRSHKTLSAIIERGLGQGLVSSSLSASELAEQLIGMWESLRFIRAILGLTTTPFEDPEDWSEKCVGTLFDRSEGSLP